MSIFNQVQFGKPKQNKFDLSHERKMTFDMGTIIPTMIQEVMPGDKFKANQEYLIRLQPLLAPIYHRVRVKTDFFFVPYRLVWNEWDKFISGGELGTDNPIQPHEFFNDANKGSWNVSSLADYFGIRPNTGQTIAQNFQISMLPFRAYTLIYNEYYRDQNLIMPAQVEKTSGIVTGSEFASITQLRKRAWEKDYFTSALPWAQKGGAVNLPTDITLKAALASKTDGDPATGGDIKITGSNVQSSTNENLWLDTIESLGITINNLRTSARLQEWLEKNARAGSRLAEFILAHFGVVSDDLRLGRPQYLGGHSNPISISEVLSTFQGIDGGTGEPTGWPQGQMTGHGVSAGAGAGFKGYFKEHGLIFGLTTVLPKTGYMQGIPRLFNRFNKFDFPFPTFAHLGEQEVYLRELYADYGAGAPDGGEVFGYQSRYADWKFQSNTTHGEFRTSQIYWHMDRDFASKPVLNESFVTSDPTSRIFNAQDAGQAILCNVYNNINVVRSLPYFSNPTL